MMMIMMTTAARNRRFIKGRCGLVLGCRCSSNATGEDEVKAGLANTLYFSVGIDSENDGLFGTITPMDGLESDEE